MARRTKRSISLPHSLAAAIDRAALDGRTTFSAWIAQTAAERLRLEVGRRALEEWEHEYGVLTPAERAEGLLRARRMLRRTAARPSRRTA